MSVRSMLIISVIGAIIGSLLSSIESIQDKSPFAKHSVINVKNKGRGGWIPGKPNAPIRLHLSSPEGMAYTGDEITEIEAMVQLIMPLPNEARYRWRLPEGVELMDGDLEGLLPDLRAGEIHQVRIRVKGLGYKEVPKNISFEVMTILNGQRIAATDIFASHLEQPDGSFKPRKEPRRSSAGWFGKANIEEDDVRIPKDKAPRGIHF